MKPGISLKRTDGPADNGGECIVCGSRRATRTLSFPNNGIAVPMCDECLRELWLMVNGVVVMDDLMNMSLCINRRRQDPRRGPRSSTAITESSLLEATLAIQTTKDNKGKPQ